MMGSGVGPGGRFLFLLDFVREIMALNKVKAKSRERAMVKKSMFDFSLGVFV